MAKKPDEKKADLLADLQRVQADFINFRRRADEERRELVGLVKQDIILELLPLLDNLDRALSHLPPDLSDHAWAKGVEQIAKQSAEVLSKMGLEKIEAVGQPFDPNLHEAVAGEGEVVAEELQPGYRLGEKVIRPAMVKVGNKEKSNG